MSAAVGFCALVLAALLVIGLGGLAFPAAPPAHITAAEVSR